jgi:hypothetical protein
VPRLIWENRRDPAIWDSLKASGLHGHGPTSQHNPNSRSPPRLLLRFFPPRRQKSIAATATPVGCTARRGHGTSPVGQSLLRRPPSPAAAALPPRQVALLLLHLTRPLVETHPCHHLLCARILLLPALCSALRSIHQWCIDLLILHQIILFFVLD